MTQHRKLGIILVDDHRRVHQTIGELISFWDDVEVLAHGHNGLEAIDLCDQFQPDLILMDIVMPLMDGVEATKRILQKYPQTKILAFSSFKDQDTIRAMLENGAVGYILKDSSVDVLESVIRLACAGQHILSPEITKVLLEKPLSQTDTNLSPREKEILRFFASGKTNSEIAATLTISVSTVKFHITNILTKLGVETRAEALVAAAKANLI